MLVTAVQYPRQCCYTCQRGGPGSPGSGWPVAPHPSLDTLGAGGHESRLLHYLHLAHHVWHQQVDCKPGKSLAMIDFKDENILGKTPLLSIIVMLIFNLKFN